nr:SDR family oxidoreductase [Catenulispora pinisilvae]
MASARSMCPKAAPAVTVPSQVTTIWLIRTPMHPEDTHDFLAALHPLGRMGEIGDVVEAVLYLEEASFVTGETLHVDGGQSAGH